MTDWWDDSAQLEAVLGHVGAALDTGATAEPLELTLEPREIGFGHEVRSRWPRWVAACVAFVVVLGTLAFTPVGDAIADWFGIGNTSVEVDRSTEPVGSDVSADVPADRIADDAAVVTADEATGILGRPLPLIPGYSNNTTVTPLEGGVLILLRGEDLTLWVRPVEGPETPIFKSGLRPPDVVDLPDLGDGGMLLSGEHRLVSPGRTIGADSVVLWTDAGLELRLEGGLPRDELVAIARSVDPSP